MKILIGILIACIMLLLGIGVVYLSLVEKHRVKELLHSGEVRGSEVVSHGLPYTLNFAQQEKLLTLLNESRKQNVKAPLVSPSLSIERLVIYRFEELPDLVLTPLTTDYSRFQVHEGQKAIVIDIKHPLVLQKLLETTFDK